VTTLVSDFAAPSRGEVRITDEPKVASIVNVTAYKFYRWRASDLRRVPVYRVELLEGDTPRAIYYLGANSYPPRFPCYSFCSGWWLGTSQEDGSFDSTRYVGLAETQYVYLLNDLDIP